MVVDVVLIDPVEEEEDDEEEEDEGWDFEDVERVETPDVEHHHQFELYGEGRGGNLLVQSLLAVFVGLGCLVQKLLPLLLVQSVLEIQDGHEETHECERKDGAKELFEFDVFGD